MFLNLSDMAIVLDTQFLDRLNNFGRVPIVLDRSNLFWLGPYNFGEVQMIKIMFKVSHEKSYLKFVEITNLQIVRNLYFDFFQRTKLRQPTGQRQLLLSQ